LSSSGRHEPAHLIGGDKRGHQLAAEEATEHLRREEVVLARVDPSVTVRVQPTAGDDAVQVRVEAQVARPGVQHTGEAELGAEPLGVGAQLEQRLAACP
jgi:hypothetical protein